ncbi:MAG: hypothetical protein K6E30_03735 [Lachnospiraceae bacterium]|nr:hypothetical protein [Lachnospiraceae bacterium]
MNTKQAAEKWNCSEKTVREYCKTGMIPLAEKTAFRWDIPDEMDKKPPVGRTKAVYLMYCIKDHTLPEIKSYWNEEKLLKALEYLSDVKFILDYAGEASLEEAVKKCRVSEFGEKLIKKEEAEMKTDNSLGVEISGEAGLENGLPIAKGKIGVKAERKQHT